MKKPTRRAVLNLSAKSRAKLRTAAAELSKRLGRKLSEQDVFEMLVEDTWDEWIRSKGNGKGEGGR